MDGRHGSVRVRDDGTLTAPEPTAHRLADRYGVPVAEIAPDAKADGDG
jgi:hypothetical protein